MGGAKDPPPGRIQPHDAVRSGTSVRTSRRERPMAMRWFLAVGVVALVPVTGAQPMTQRGTQELSGHVSPDFEGAIGDMLLAQAGYGYFVRDGLAVRATVAYAVLEDVAGEDSDYRMQEVGLAAELHLRRWGPLVPHVGAGLGWHRSHFGEREESALFYGPRAGVEYFLADNVALDLEVTYKLSSAAVFINDFVAEDSDVTTVIGLRVFF
jgi:opacity protein-like surface antigen